MAVKRIIYTVLLSILVNTLQGQEYIRTADSPFDPFHSVFLIYKYTIGEDGLYHYSEGTPNVLLTYKQYKEDLIGVEHFFCYDKKDDSFYFYTDNAIACYHPMQNDYIEGMKREMKAHKIKNVKEDEIDEMISPIQQRMDLYYRQKNDSLLAVFKIQQEQKRRDSLEAEIRNKEQEAERRSTYRATHSWHDMHLKKNSFLHCKGCNEIHVEKDFYVVSLSSDTIYFLLSNKEISLLGQKYSEIHYAEMSPGLKKDAGFQDYISIWQDSLANNNRMSNDQATRMNMLLFSDFTRKIKEIAPWGFIANWGWHLNTAYGIEPYFSYFNTTAKVIKYVDFFFNIYNPVGDKCFLRYENSYTGSVRGVGPVDSFKSSSWNWERATHYTSGDASELKIIKLVITFMDGTKKVLTGNMIKYGY